MTLYGKKIRSNISNINEIENELSYMENNRSLNLVCNSLDVYKQHVLSSDFAIVNGSQFYNEHKLYNAEADYMFVITGFPFSTFERRGFDSTQAVTFTAKYLSEKWNDFCLVKGIRENRKRKSDLQSFFIELGYKDVQVQFHTELAPNTLICRTSLFFESDKEQFISLEKAKDKMPIVAVGDSKLPTYYYQGNVRMNVEITDLEITMEKNGQFKHYTLTKLKNVNFHANVKSSKYKAFLQHTFVEYPYLLICLNHTGSNRTLESPQKVVFFNSEKDFAEFVVNRQKSNYNINIL